MNLITAFLLGLLSLAPAASNQHSDQAQLLVKFKDGTTSQVANEEAGHHGHVKGQVGKLGQLVLQVDGKDKQKAIDALAHNPKVQYVEEDALAQATDLPSDTNFAKQWGLNNTGQSVGGVTGTADADIDAPEAWAVTQGAGVKVAVLDTGVDQNHPDLSSQIVANQNFTTAATADDNYGHGTHVAGIIAAVTDNGQGVAGGCPACQIMNVKVLRDDGAGYTSWIANGMVWATDNGAKVINLSLGSSSPSQTMQSAVDYAWSHGVVVVAAAGNSGNRSKLYPAAYPHAIAVAATDNRDRKASFSNYDWRWVDLAAPGVNVFSTTPEHPYAIGLAQGYDYLSGTSMATPMVSAAAALTWSSSFGTSATSVRNRLESRADRIAGTGNYWSAGRVNAARAVTP